MKIVLRLSMMAVMLMVLQAPQASALTVITSFIGGNPPANAVGGGNLMDIVNAAARIWESAYSDPITITIHFGWAPVGDAGIHSLVEQGGSPNREITGMILFDNSGAARFYLDPTPNSNEEYRRLTEEKQDLGGGMINVARLYSSPTGEAVGHTDLLSVVLHEIGHAMGMCAANTAFIQAARQGSLHISGDLSYAGTVIPLATNKAGITSHFDALLVTYGSVMAGVSSDERRIPSELDIMANAQVSGFTLAGAEASQPLPSRVSPVRSIGRMSANASTVRK